ncbi:TolC family protein [Arcticibacter eurypsychrophilus]|uniref:TolC family protein n=1 Tax=Arcticibacter eurypsychrophilus TaxID=1434752 RepID=UPI00084DC55D|nr:TolC family protein [Arcticibacter eurypsychrophilus]
MRYLFCFLILILIFPDANAQQHNLDEYLQVAISNSPLTKDLNNQVLSAQIDSVRLQAGFKPQVSGIAGGLYAPVIHGIGYSTAISNGQSLNAQVSVNKTFISKSYLNAQLYSLFFQRDSLRNAVKLSEQDLRKTITAQYITAYGSLEQQNFNQELVDILAKEEDVLKKLTRNNVYKQSDYLTFLVTLKQAQLQLSQLKLQYKTDLATLNYLAGIADTATITLGKPDLPRVIVFDKQNSIFFRQFKIDSMRLQNSHALVDYGYKPKFTLFADGGYNSDLSKEYYKHLGASAGFGLTIPIYDGRQKKLAHKKLQLEEDTRRNYLNFFDRQYAQQINQLRQQINGFDSLLIEIKDQFKYSESLIKVDTQLMQTGDLRIADLVLAINGYLTIKNQLTQNGINQLQLINQLNYWNK